MFGECSVDFVFSEKLCLEMPLLNMAQPFSTSEFNLISPSAYESGIVNANPRRWIYQKTKYVLIFKILQLVRILKLSLFEIVFKL